MKSKTQTDSEILNSAKEADVINPQGTISEIRIRNSSAIHPVQCQCDLHRIIRFDNYSTKNEEEEKAKLDWYNGD